MRIILAPTAQRELKHQLQYLIDHNAALVARDLERRLVAYIDQTLVFAPRSGKHLAHRGLWEIWVPRTRLVLWYRFDHDTLEIARVWHTAQDRSSDPTEP